MQSLENDNNDKLCSSSIGDDEKCNYIKTITVVIQSGGELLLNLK